MPTTRREFLAGVSAAALAAGARAGSAAGKDRIGVGFIGCGGRQNAHLRAVNWLKEHGKEAVDIVAVCDVYRTRMKRAAEAYNAKGTMDHRELLADKNVDVVCIATPDHHHGPQTIDAFRAGKDVYCEKPFVHWRQLPVAFEAAAVGEKLGRVFQLGTQGMSDAAWHQGAKLVADGAIGRPIHAECGYFRVGDWGERGMRIDDPKARPGPDLNWEAFLGDAPRHDFDVSRFFRWRMYEDYAGGPVTDLFPHSLTPVAHMLPVGMPALAVATGGKFRYEQREVPDTFNMLVDYPEKVTVAVLGTQGNPYQGTGGRGAGARRPILRGWDAAMTFEGNDIVVHPVDRKKKPTRTPIEHGENLVEHWRNFLACVRGHDRNTNSPIDLACRVQAALNLAMHSLRHGTTARLDAKAGKIV